MYNRLVKFVLSLVLACFSLLAFAQSFDRELGYYYIRNYSPKEYKEAAQNWAIVQDKAGLMYFCNNLGVLEYDGTDWRLIDINESTYLRSLAKDAKNRIYVGGKDEFGYLKPNAKGILQFSSLKPFIKGNLTEFGDVWKIEVTPDNKVYFQTQKHIFIWDGKSIKTIASELPIHTFFQVKGSLFAKVKGGGLYLLKDEKLVLINGSEIFASTGVYALMETSGEYLIAVTRDQGLYKVHNPLNPSMVKFEHLETEAEKYLSGFPAYNGIRISENLYSIGMLGGGVMFIDEQGHIKKLVRKEEGLNDETVYAQYLDAHQNLWLATDYGISRIEINSPITYFNEKGELNGTVLASKRFNNNLYVATHLGVYELQEYQPKDNHHAHFKMMEGINSEVFSLEIFNRGAASCLLIATAEGLMWYKGGMVTKVGTSRLVFNIFQSNLCPDRIFVTTEDGLHSLLFNGSTFTDEAIIYPETGEISSIVEEVSGSLWIGTLDHGLKKIQLTFSGTKITGASLINTTISKGNVTVGKFGNRLIIGNQGDGLYSVEISENNFDVKPVRALDLEASIGHKEIFVHRIQEDQKGCLWLSLVSGKNFIVGYLFKEKESVVWNERLFKPVSKEIIHSLFPEEKIAWLGGADGLYRIDRSAMNAETHKDFYAVIRTVFVNKDSLFFGGSSFTEDSTYSLKQGTNQIITLPYKWNSLNFQFAALNYENEEDNLYSYYLEGYDQSWSNWQKKKEATFTNLHEGKYTFKVKAKNIYGYESIIAEYSFDILPPWYRTIWAYLVYVVGFIGFVYSAIAYTTRGLRSIIRKQTAEVVAQKEEIERKNKDITDSIHYAKRIQNAILPNLEEIKTAFPDSFILFKPRDVVSGDFYWFANTVIANTTYPVLAAADCTGHGVPGAFMSMIGNTILNEIIITNPTINASQILKELHLGIRSALKQNENESRDGMDMALCCVDKANKKVYFSGANRSLMIVRKGQLTEVKPTKAAIGGFTTDDQLFDLHAIDYQEGDCFYMASDGYADQFGGTEGKKFMTKKFKEIILANYNFPMVKQREVLDNVIEDWRGDYEQVDDILVIGFRL